MKPWQIIVSVLLVVGICQKAAAEKSILIIQSYHQGLAWTEQCEKGIHSVLDEGHTVRTVYMDTKRLSENRFRERADAAWQVYEQMEPDLVMIGDDNGLRLLGDRFGKVKTPVVYFGINNNPRSYFTGRIPRNITGVLERLPVFPWLRYLKQIMPNAETVLLLMDSSPTSTAISNAVFQGRDRITAVGFTTELKRTADWEEWQSLVRQGEWDLVLMPTFHAVKDDDGSHVNTAKVVEWTSANAGVPVFSHQDYSVGEKGATGAYVVWGLTHGILAGTIAIKILEQGLAPWQIPPVTDENGQFVFNKKNLIKFNLRLPESIRLNAIFH